MPLSMEEMMSDSHKYDEMAKLSAPAAAAMAMADKYEAAISEASKMRWLWHKNELELKARIRELEAALAAEKENARIGWANFETFRKKYAEIRFPGMTGEIHSASDAAAVTK
jgi:hypothetical protein